MSCSIRTRRYCRLQYFRQIMAYVVGKLRLWILCRLASSCKQEQLIGRATQRQKSPPSQHRWTSAHDQQSDACAVSRETSSTLPEAAELYGALLLARLKSIPRSLLCVLAWFSRLLLTSTSATRPLHDPYPAYQLCRSAFRERVSTPIAVSCRRPAAGMSVVPEQSAACSPQDVDALSHRTTSHANDGAPR